MDCSLPLHVMGSQSHVRFPIGDTSVDSRPGARACSSRQLRPRPLEGPRPRLASTVFSRTTGPARNPPWRRMRCSRPAVDEREARREVMDANNRNWRCNGEDETRRMEAQWEAHPRAENRPVAVEESIERWERVLDGKGREGARLDAKSRPCPQRTSGWSCRSSTCAVASGSEGPRVHSPVSPRGMTRIPGDRDSKGPA
eukprot:scaffold283_cov316-Pavlova_lutheri.AAC.20